MKRFSYIFILGIIAAVVLIGAGIGGYFVFVKPTTRPSTICGGVRGIQCPPNYYCEYPSPYIPDNFGSCKLKTYQTTSTIDASTWKTYRNERYGFEVRYPVNVTIKMDEGYKYAEFSACETSSCAIFIVLDWGELLDPNYRLLEDPSGLNPFYIYAVETHSLIVNQILSTFKFVEPK